MRNFNFNISSLFGSNQTSSLFGEFANKKTGSYRRLLKTYYSDQKKAASEIKKTKDELSSLKSQKGDKTTYEKVNPALNSMKKESDGLKTAAEALGKEELWNTKDGEYDIEKITGAIKSFANEYNDVIDQTSKVSSKSISQTANYMKSLTNTMSKALAKVGVNVDKEGKISVDEDVLKKADIKSLKSIFGGKASYGSQIAERAQEISRDTVLDSSMYSKNGYLPNSGWGSFSKWI